MANVQQQRMRLFSLMGLLKKEGSCYWLTGKGQSGGTPPPYGRVMEWYFMWRNQNMPLTGACGEWRPSCTFDRRRRKKSEGVHLEPRAGEGSNLTFSLSFRWIPSRLIFPPTCGRRRICYARKCTINDWRKASLQKKMLLFFEILAHEIFNRNKYSQ